MKYLKIIFIIIGSIIGLLLVVTLLLPSKYSVTRSIEIKSQVSIPFELVNNMKSWEKWSPWYEMDKTMKLKYEGPERGNGASYSWVSKKEELGTGKMVNIEVIEGKKIVQDMYFDDKKGGTETFTFDEKNGVTKLTWTMEGEMTFLFKWVGLFMNKLMGHTFEKGLANLKKISEMPINIIISEENKQANTIAYIRDSTDHNDMAGITSKMGKAYSEIANFVTKNKFTFVGPPIARTIEYKSKYIFEPAMPINATKEQLKSEGRISIGKTYEGKVVKGIYTGAYDNLESAYSRIMTYITSKGLVINGFSWEEYLNDPGNTPPDKLTTIIYFPVK